MKSVYAKTVYQKRFMGIGWFLGAMTLVAFTLAFYNSFSSGALGESLQNLPPALQKLVGDVSSFKTVGGYISQQIFALRVPLLLMILSIAALIGVSASEEQQGLVETQLTLPIGRTKLLLQKLAAASTIIVIGGGLGVMAGVQVGLLFAGQSYNVLNVLPHLINAMLVAFNYGMVGFAIAALTGRKGLALGISSGLAFASYLVNTMAVSVSALGAADKLTLFHYYSTTGSYNWHNLLLQVAVALILVIVSLIGFTHRDIRAR